MSHKLPVVSGKQLLKALTALGYYVRDRESSHIHVRHPTRPPLTIPDHKEIARGTLRTGAVARHTAGVGPFELQVLEVALG